MCCKRDFMAVLNQKSRAFLEKNSYLQIVNYVQKLDI